MTRISGAELSWHGEASFSGWQDEGWGSLVSSQDSKQKASETRRQDEFVNVLCLEAPSFA